MTNWNEWIADNTVATDTVWINGIQYMFGMLKDGWIAIFEVGRTGQLYPQIQASDMAHAQSWCSMREPITVPMNVIC